MSRHVAGADGRTIGKRPIESAPSLTVVLTFSMSAGLAASTVTPGRTAPDESRTVPAIDCAETSAGAPLSNEKWPPDRCV
jgi:hypothetical protein